MAELPPFVDDQLLDLHKQLLFNEDQLATTSNSLQEIRERFKVLSEHKINVEQELHHTKQVLAARNDEISTEEHLIAVASREKGKCEVDIKNFKKLSNELKDRINAVQNDLFVASDRMDKFRDAHHLNQQQLDQWFIAAKQKDEDASVLSKYTAVDAEKEKEFLRKLQKVELEVRDKKLELDNLLTETKSIQIELERTAEDFKGLHEERRRLVSKWDEAVNAMTKRDVQLKIAGEELTELRQNIREVEQKVAQRTKIHTTISAQNRDFLSKIDQQERKIQKFRELVTGKTQENSSLTSELQSLENTLSNAEIECRRVISTNDSLQKDVLKLSKMIDIKESEYSDLSNVLNKQQSKAIQKEQATRTLEKMLKDEGSRLAATEAELEATRREIYELSQELFNLKTREANILAEISGTNRARNNVLSSLIKQEQETSKLNEVIYSIDFQIQIMERKVSRASGERSDEEKRKLLAKISEGEVQLAEIKKREALVRSQLAQVESSIRTTSHRVSEICKNHDKLQVEINELELENTGLDQEQNNQTQKKTELQLEHDLFEMKLDSAQKKLDNKADEVSALESKLSQLRTEIEERTEKINLHMDVQRFEQRVLETERQKLAADLNERLIKMEKLKAKKEVLESRVTKLDGETGERQTQSYLIVANAQKREELQRQGDFLDKEIKKAVNDLQQLEVLYQQTENSNTCYKKKLMGEDEESEALVVDLESRARGLVSQVNEMRREKVELEREVSYKQQVLSELKGEEAELRNEVETLNDNLNTIRQKITQLEEQEARSKKSAVRLSRDHRKSNQSEDLTYFEQRLFASQLRSIKKELTSGLIDLIPLLDESLKSEVLEALQSVGSMPRS
ncbi:hypothetical protein RCL1_005172 [Eukaryota sp. TZLM3-RCL]